MKKPTALSTFHGNGNIYIIFILAAILLFATVFSGLPFNPRSSATDRSDPQYTCCDTGDGEACKPIKDKSFSYQGDRYELLKSNIFLSSTTHHVDPAENNARGRNNERLFVNAITTRFKGNKAHPPQCGPDSRAGKDWLYGPRTPEVPPERKLGCYTIPNEMLLYACRRDNKSGACQGDLGRDVRFDAYYRVGDGEIPDVIKNCVKPPLTTRSKQSITGLPEPKGQSNLQLETFQVIDSIPVGSWVSPYCKPAIYLYPESLSQVHVKVEPKGKMTLTIPKYPAGGWHVLAYPGSRISHQNIFYDYLYYEAEIPDVLIPKPTSGYVVPHAELAGLLDDILPKLGLNKNESEQFSEYWLKVLPASPYYLVGAVPESHLDMIAPLTISPTPDKTIRVSLYFEALDTKIAIPEPVFPHITREGFTAVEWGGFIKLQKGQTFTCLQ